MILSNSMRACKARPEDMEKVYLMGLDAWGKEKSVQEYLDSCRDSPKYKCGEWHVLEDVEKSPVCSLIMYRFNTTASRPSLPAVLLVSLPVKVGRFCTVRKLRWACPL
jgi:hypothetical protein